jgi:hypothetical protein
MIFKLCPQCGKSKPIEKFSIEHGTYRKRLCFACDSANRLKNPKRKEYMKAYRAEYRKNGPKRNRKKEETS